ncbi:MAG: hypothetical protein ABSG84_04320 [Acidobacteriaceae bacterium]|jgi:hypothetical protein
MSTNSLRTLQREASKSVRRPGTLVAPARFGCLARALTISIAAVAALLTVGCGSNAQFQSPNTNAVTGIRGKVRGGQQPITGSTIQLYAVGTTGDGSAATALLNPLNPPVTTDSSGDFTISNDYTCPTPTSANVYLTATGGNPGLAPGTNNPNISMIAALGPCSGLNNSTYIWVNEATTIASVFPFDDGGFQFISSYADLGSGTSDAATLNTDFATVNEFVDTTNGTSPGPGPLPPGSGVPTAKLYTLSNIISTCINSPGGVAGDNSPCGDLFADATPPPGPGVVPPTDIVGALIDIANNPNNNVNALFMLAPSSGPFQPTLPIAPTDWTLPIEPTITMSLPSTLIGNGNTLTGTVTLSQGAPSGGLTVNVTSSQVGFVTVNSVGATTVTINSGQTSGTFQYQGVAGGTSVIEANGTGYISDTASVTSTASLVSLGTIPTLAPGQMVSLPLSLGTAAPAGGVTVNFATAAGVPAPASLATVVPASVFIAAGLTVPTANPQVTGGTIGATQITASATGYAPDIVTANVSLTAAFTPNTLSMPVSPPLGSLNLTISAPAPAPNGIMFTLSSNNAAAATVPMNVTIPAGQTSIAVPVTGVAAGTATITAQSAGITSATATVNVGGAITVSGAIIGQFMQGTISVSLPSTPTAAINVTVTSGSPSVMLSKSNTTVGTNSVTFTSVTTSFVGTVYVQGQPLGAGMSASATITAAANAGYANGTSTVSVYPSGFVINPGQSSLTTTTLSPATNVTLFPALLSPNSLAYYTTGQLNPGVTTAYPASFSVPMSIPVAGAGVGTISSPVVFNDGDSSDSASFQPTGPGNTTISIVSQPAGFSTPAGQQYQSIPVTVTQPTITVSSTIIGQYMQGTLSVNLQTAPKTPITVTVASGTPGAVLLSTSGTVAATPATGTTLTFNNVTTSSIGPIYVQGQSLGAGAQGSSIITVTAPGYANGTGTVTVYPSGFIINPSQPSITTTTLSTPTIVTLFPAMLNPMGLGLYTYGQLNPGIGPISLPMSSSLQGVGTISSPVVFNGGDSSDTASFQPVGAGGPTTLSISGPPTINSGIGPQLTFSTPSSYQSIPATVNLPTITVSPPIIGQLMQGTLSINLQTAPKTPITVTVTTGTPADVLLSTSATVAATPATGTMLTFNNVTSSSLPPIYVQGQSFGAGAQGSSLITVTAPGYTNGTGTVAVYPSGFVINTSQPSISTTTFSTPTTLTLFPALLYPNTLAYYTYGQLDPGISQVGVNITSSNLAVGTITTSPVAFNAGDSSDSTQFQPVATGTTTLALGLVAPPGFSIPSNYQSIPATVTAPNATIGSATVGANMQGSLSVGLATAPPSAVTVTVTSNGPSIATISKSATAVGGTSLTFNNVTGTSIPPIYVQGQTVGTTTVTVEAPGYNNANGNITVMPSGFVINPSQGNITTTVTSSPTTVTLFPEILNSGVLTPYNSGQLNPGIGPFDLVFSSSNTNAGTITTSPVVFNAGATSGSTTFQPASQGGTTTLSIGALTNNGPPLPTPFSVPSQNQSITATVTSTNINVSSTTVGTNMQGPISVSLGTTPTALVNVVVSVTGGTLGAVLLSKSASAVGSTSVMFSNVSTTSVGQVFVQGQVVGTATITAVATLASNGGSAGYNNGTGTITVDPSGFVINPSQGNITTTTLSPPTTVTLFPEILNPGVLTPYGSGQLNPGIGPFGLVFSSSNTNFGTITTSPVVFNAGDTSDSTTFQPAMQAGTTTLSIGALTNNGPALPSPFMTPSQDQSILATVSMPNITVGSTTVGEYMQGPIGVSLQATPVVPVNVTVSVTAGAGTVLLSTSPTAVGSNSVTFTSVTTSSVGQVYVQGQGATGTATITAVATLTSNNSMSAGYSNGTGTITVNPSGFVINPSQGNITATPQSNPTTITLMPAILNPGILTYYTSSTLDPNVSFNVPITSSNMNAGTLSSTSVAFAGGSSSATTIFQPGTMTGTTTIAITDPLNFPFSTPSQDQSITATLSTPNINISNTTTGVSLETPVSISLSATPLTPVNVTVASNGTSIATVSNSATTFGQPSVTFTGVTGTTVGTVWVQGQSLGTTTLTATASGYNNGTGTVTVNPSGFVINPSQSNISTTPTSPATAITLDPAILYPGILTFYGTAELNPGIGPFNIGITSSNTAAGTITTSPVVFHGGDLSDSTAFQPVAAGTTNLVLGAQPAGFSTPTELQQITANVVAALGASIGSTTTGVNLETPVSVELGTAPGSPGILVTVTIANGTGSAVISNSATTVGGATCTFANVTTTNAGTCWVQGLTTGTATLNVGAPGYTPGTGTVTIDPSGFIFTSGNISTTTFSPPTTIDIQPAILEPSLFTVVSYGQLSPAIGSPQVDVDITGNPGIGSITTSPVTFASSSTLATTSFMPTNQGTTTIGLNTPVGFSTPSQQQYTQLSATVVAPSSNINSVTTGVNLEAPTYIDLGVVPSGTVNLNVSIANSPSSPGAPVAVISTSPTTVGGQSLNLNATTSSVGPIYVQGLNQGTAIITVTPASEYAGSSGTVTVDPSGFIISSGNIVTTPTSSPTTVTVAPAVLTPGLLTFYGYGQLSPVTGGSIPLYSVPLTIPGSGAGVGSITTSPVALNAGDTSDNTTFMPLGTGSTTITLGPEPAGFSTPSQPQFTQVSATVVAPNGTSIGNTTTGVNMQTPVDVVLGSAPSSPISVTVTSGTAAVATVAPNATTAGIVNAGVSSYTFTNVTSAFVGTVYIQGQTVGTSTLTVTNTGTFTTGTGTATVNPSGFVINSGNILTTLASSPTVMVVPAVLNPGVLTLYDYGQLNPGIGPYDLAVTSGNAGVGTISTSPVSLGGGATSATTTFQPVAAGTTTVSLPATPPASGLPGAFSTPSQYQQITATVTAPGITVGNVVTGVNMENPLVGITLSVAPTSPINVTVTVSGGTIATVSSSATAAGTVTAGTSSITIPNVSTANVGTIWIQGQSLGSTTITVSAPGYTSGIGLATVDPSGFVLQTGDFATTNTSPATTIPIYAAVLDPNTLDYVGSAQLNPGLSVNVPFNSSAMNVGTTAPNPVPFTGGAASENAAFTPAGTVGTSTLSLGTPAGFSTPSQTSTQQIIATVD